MYRIVTMPLRTNTIKILCQQSYSYHTIPSLRFTRYLAHPHAAPTPHHTPTRHAHPPDPPYPHTHTPCFNSLMCLHIQRFWITLQKETPLSFVWKRGAGASVSEGTNEF